MADSALTPLTAASTLDGTELYYTVQGGADRKATGAQIKALSSNPTFFYELYDDFNRADTAAATLTAPVVGGAYDIRQGGGVAATTSGQITSHRLVTTPGTSTYVMQQLSGLVSRIGCRFRWTSQSSGSDPSVMALVITPNVTAGANYVVGGSGVHVIMDRNHFNIQYYYGGVATSVDGLVYASPLSLNTTYTVNIEIVGNRVQYAICGFTGTVVVKDMPTATLGRYAIFEHFYPSSTLADRPEVESIWAAVAPAGAGTMTESCIAAYKFQSSSWLDASGRGHTLTGVNTPTITTGIVGNGASLVAASSQSFTLADHTDIRLAGKDWTISVWFKPTTVSGGGYAPIVAKDNGNGAIEFVLYIDKSSAQVLGMVSIDGGQVNVVFVGGDVVTAGQWSNAIMYYDATAGTLAMTVNNATATGNLLSSMYAGSAAALTIGTSPWLAGLGTAKFDGVIDELYIFTTCPGFGGRGDLTKRGLLYNAGDGLSWPLGC